MYVTHISRSTQSVFTQCCLAEVAVAVSEVQVVCKFVDDFDRILQVLAAVARGDAEARPTQQQAAGGEGHDHHGQAALQTHSRERCDLQPYMIITWIRQHMDIY
jgi:hypothetical protein